MAHDKQVSNTKITRFFYIFLVMSLLSLKIIEKKKTHSSYFSPSLLLVLLIIKIDAIKKNLIFIYKIKFSTKL